MKTFWILFIARMKMLLRDRSSLLFAFAFPIVLLFFFGFVLQNQGKITLNVSVYKGVDNYWVDEAFTIISVSDVFEIEEVTDLEAAQEEVRRGKKDYLLVFQENEYGGVEMNVQYGLKEADNYQAVIGPIMEGIVLQANFGPLVWEALERGDEEAVSRVNNYTLEDTLISESEANLVVAGMNGWILQSLVLYTIMGMARIVAEEKQMNVLKRLSITNVRKWHYLAAYVSSFMFIGLIQTGILIVMSHTIFDIVITNIGLYILATIAITMMISMIGLFVGSISKNTNMALGISQIIGFPLIILSGSWFPLSLFPLWLQEISKYSPLTQAKFLLDQVGAVAVPEVQMATVITLFCTTLFFGIVSIFTFRFRS